MISLLIDFLKKKIIHRYNVYFEIECPSRDSSENPFLCDFLSHKKD
jgi:hypothetical protein